MIKIESRKIFVVGKRSLAITLPKRWIQQHNLNVGDVLEVILNDDGTLLLKPIRVRSEPLITSETTIDADAIPRNWLLSVVMGYYINGYDAIRIVSKKPIADVLAELGQKLIGTVVTGSGNEYLVKFVLSEDKLALDEIMNRMILILNSVIEHYIEYLRVRDNSLLEKILNLEEEIDRLYYLGMRILINSLLKSFTEGSYEEGKNCMFKMLGLKIIEDISDAIDRSVRAIYRVSQDGIELPKEYEDLAKSVAKISIDAARAFKESDMHRALKVLELRVEVKKGILSMKSRSKELLQILLSELEIMITFAADLAELAIVSAAGKSE